MGLFSKKETKKEVPADQPALVPIEFVLDTNDLKIKLQTAYLEAKGKLTNLTREQVQKLLESWSSKLPGLLAEAILTREDTIYFFNHEKPPIANTDWLYAAHQFAAIIRSSFGVEVEISTGGTICIKIQTEALEEVLESPELEKKFHQQGIYR